MERDGKKPVKGVLMNQLLLKTTGAQHLWEPLEEHRNVPQDCPTQTSLVVQWLRLHLAMQGVQIRSLVGELRSHMPHGQKTKT